MWIQAATTMSMYQAVSAATLASTPRTTPAPQIVKSDATTQAQSADSNPFTELENLLNNPKITSILEQLGIGNDTVAHDPVVDNALDNFIANILKNFGYNWSPGEGTLNGLEYDAYTDPTMAAFWVARALELTEDFQQFFVYLQTNPVLAFQYLVSLELYDWPIHLAEIFTLVGQPELLLAVVPVAAAPLAAVGGLAGLAGLAAIPPPPAAPALVPAVPLPAARHRPGLLCAHARRVGPGAGSGAVQPRRPRASGTDTAARASACGGLFPAVPGRPSGHRVRLGNEHRRQLERQEESAGTR
jgi:PPE-repeat protein